MKAIENTFKIMKTSIYIRDINVESNLVWHASLSIFIGLYNVDFKVKSHTYSIYNNFISLILFRYNMINVGKVFYRKLSNK